MRVKLKHLMYPEENNLHYPQPDQRKKNKKIFRFDSMYYIIISVCDLYCIYNELNYVLLIVIPSFVNHVVYNS